MAIMVGRKIWYRRTAAICSGIVTRQVFNPDIIYAISDDGVEAELSPMSYFLTPEEAIGQARDYADLILYFADKLEKSLEGEEK